MRDIIERQARRRGASTLTQQLARKLFLTDEKTWERKIKEALLAIQIEKRYTKQEIFTLYCNQMYFGHGVYGVEAASRLYFGKSAKDLTPSGSGADRRHPAGQRPPEPVREHGRALRRRNYALGRMAEVGFITAEEAEAAKKRPIAVRPDPPTQASAAPYFLEEVRKELEGRYGAKQLYENGLSIQTALDLQLQEAATERARRRPAARRQAARLPQAAPQRQRRGPLDRQVREPALGSSDGRRRHRAGGRDRARGHDRSWRAPARCASTIDRKGYAWTGKTTPAAAG